MLVRKQAGGLGADATLCQGLITGQMQYVPVDQFHGDAMVAACASVGLDVSKAPGLLPPQFVTPATSDQPPAVNPYYTAYTDAQAASTTQLLAVNPDASTAGLITDRTVFQGTAPQLAPASGTQQPPTSGTQQPPTSGTQQPPTSGTDGGTDPGPTIDDDGRIVLSTPLTPRTAAAAVDDLVQQLREQISQLPWYVWLGLGLLVGTRKERRA